MYHTGVCSRVVLFQTCFLHKRLWENCCQFIVNCTTIIIFELIIVEQEAEDTTELKLIPRMKALAVLALIKDLVQNE
jgi:hypothetical protein